MFSQYKINPHFSFKIPEKHCRNGPYDSECVTETDFEKAFDTKSFYLWSNRKRLDLLDYSGDTPVVNESFVQFITIPKVSKTVVYSVQLTEIMREDSLLMALEGITDIEESFFNVVHLKDLDRILTYESSARLQIAIELSDEVTLVERHVYNSFMLLGDVGGFSGLLFAIGSVLVRIFNFANAQNFVVQSLYEGELLDDTGKASGNSYELDSRK